MSILDGSAAEYFREVAEASVNNPYSTGTTRSSVLGELLDYSV